jgi:IclR family pca regulon transcriptional regulator
LNAFFAAITPEAITPKTVTDPVLLRKMLEQVDDEGFALAEQEAELGFRSLAVPVRRQTGEVQFALNVGMSVHRAPFDTMRSRFVPLLREAAERLQEQLL